MLPPFAGELRRSAPRARNKLFFRYGTFRGLGEMFASISDRCGERQKTVGLYRKMHYLCTTLTITICLYGKIPPNHRIVSLSAGRPRDTRRRRTDAGRTPLYRWWMVCGRSQGIPFGRSHYRCAPDREIPLERRLVCEDGHLVRKESDPVEGCLYREDNRTAHLSHGLHVRILQFRPIFEQQRFLIPHRLELRRDLLLRPTTRCLLYVEPSNVLRFGRRILRRRRMDRSENGTGLQCLGTLRLPSVPRHREIVPYRKRSRIPRARPPRRSNLSADHVKKQS